jgi:hypothetical protein
VGGIPEESARARRIAWGFALGTTLLHLVLAGRYDYHRDELYFIECGRHLAFGYVDHPSFVPFVARLADSGFGANLYALRFLPAVACGASILLAARFVRELGGGWLATLFVCLSLSAAPAYQRMGALLCIPVFEPVFWTLANLLVWQILNGASPRRWLWVGLVVGVGLHDKHSMLLWVAGIAGGLALTSERRRLFGPWPWLGLVVAFVLFVPNLVWQLQHDFATLTFLRNMSKTTLAGIPVHLFLLGQLLFMNPLTAPLWILGLLSLLGGDSPRRVLGFAFLVVVAALLVTHGKPYYLAPAYPVLLAAGAIAFEKRFGARRPVVGGAIAALAVTSIVFGLVGLPILPVTSIDRGLQVSLGKLVKPEELTRELHDQYGFREQVDVVAAVYDSLPSEERERALVLTANYGEASAVNFFGASRGLPRAISGHMNYFLWGVPPGKGDVVITYGVPRERIESVYSDVRVVGRMDHPLAMPNERNLVVFVARAPRLPLVDAWPRFQRYQHGR